MPRKTIALLRVSTEAQAGPDRGGLSSQRRACEQIATANSLEIVEEVTLEGVSGASVLSDPRFSALLQRLQDPAIDGVIVAELSRLMRPERFSDYEILEAFRSSGKKLFTAEGVRDVREFGGRLLSVLQAELAAYERQQIKERTRRGREEKRRQGKRAEGLVGMPRGVRFDPGTGEWSYTYPEADRVRRAFDLWLESEGTLPFAEIGRRVGLSSGSWAIRNVLGQPLYKGVYRVDRRWVNGKPEPRQPHEIYEKRVLDPPLVSTHEWDRAQKLLEARGPKRPPRRDPDAHDGTYSGFLECADCGSHLWMHPASRRVTSSGATSVQAAAYTCPGTPSKKCRTGFNSHRLADPRIDSALEARLGSRGTLRRLIDESLAEAETVAKADCGAMTRRLTELENSKTRAKDAYMEGAFDLPELKKRLALLDAEIAAVQQLQESQEEPIEVSPAIVRDLVDVFSSWRDLGRDEKRSLLRAFRIRIRVEKRAQRRLSVASVRLGVFRDDFSIYKKMKRLGIE